MLNRRSCKAALVAIALLALAFSSGCSKSAQQDPAAKRADGKAKKELSAYKELVAANNFELAATVGRDLVKNYPNSPAAAEVGKTLADVEAKAQSVEDKKKAASAWEYRSTDEGDVMQHFASIYSVKPGAAPQRVRLTLRRHAEMGQSVFLDGEKDGFQCGTPCTVSVWFDSSPREAWEGDMPPGAGPKFFFRDDAKFIEKLDGATTLTISARRQNQGLQTLVFDVSGFNPKRFPKLAER